MYSSQDEKLVRNETKLIHDTNELKLLNAKRKYFNTYNCNEPLVINEDHIKEISPKYEVDKFNAVNFNLPEESCIEERYEKVEVELSDHSILINIFVLHIYGQRRKQRIRMNL